MPILNTEDTLQQFDSGIGIIIQAVQSDGKTPVNLSAATNLLIYLTKPDSTIVTYNGTLYSDGTDGKVQAITGINDLNLIGLYKIQLNYTIGITIKSTEIGGLFVEANL